MSLLMFFIDGFGLGEADPIKNPFLTAEMPFFRRILNGEALTQEVIQEGIAEPGLTIWPTDATLATKGLPQSATGQTTLFTGINAARYCGRHINGFPTKSLRGLLEERGIFKTINQAGLRSTFANTFTTEYFETVRRGKWRHSATTTAALAGGCRLLMIPDLIEGQAVYQDITNEQLLEKDYQVDVLTPEAAAANLLNVAVAQDFTLFEYFQTDRCGHSQNRELAELLLNRLDRFIGRLADCLESNRLSLLITSDHGNIEDLSVRTHTLNKVPTIIMGSAAGRFPKVTSLTDIYPGILAFLGVPAQANPDLPADFLALERDLSR